MKRGAAGPNGHTVTKRAFVDVDRGHCDPLRSGCPENDCPLRREIAAWVLKCWAAVKLLTPLYPGPPGSNRGTDP